MRNIARELQTMITNYLNEQISQVTFLSEDSKDIEFEIKNNLQKIGLACVVMTPSFEYIGRTKEGQAWDIKGLTIMMTEYVPMNRAKNKTTWCSGFDVAFEVTDVLAGPNANCGFGKFCPVNIEQGEDDGLLVVKATFDCSVVSKFDDEIPVWGEGKYILEWTDTYGEHSGVLYWNDTYGKYEDARGELSEEMFIYQFQPPENWINTPFTFDKTKIVQELVCEKDGDPTNKITARLTWTKNS